VAGDPRFARLCGRARIPSNRTVGNWLQQFTQASLGALVRLNRELLYEQIQQLDWRRLASDIDGTVSRTGGKLAGALRGFNPPHPQDPSYYPRLAHRAPTGQILRLKNRPGNVPDRKGAEPFGRELSDEIRGRLERSLPLEFRMDAAFFQQNLLNLRARRGCCYALKLPCCKWTGVKALGAAQQPWTAVAAELSSCETQLKLAPWALDLRVVGYRKRVHHQRPKNDQLELFSPDHGYFEYSAVTTKLALTPPMLWYFTAGRGAQQKTFAELKGEFALVVVPTNHDGAKSAWPQRSILAHNLLRSFQLHSALATPKPRSRKPTYADRIASIKTLRFRFINRAARLARISRRKVLRFAPNSAAQMLYTQVADRLVA
jgi:hypothetical protein